MVSVSTATSYSLPARSPREAQEHPRHIEIISTRGQRRARPRIVYGLVAVGGLFLILMAQLLLSIALSGGSYQISALQTEQRNLARDQQTLTESLRVLQSPQNLAARATTLGMVMNNTGSGWLRLSDGAILKDPSAAASTSATDASGQSLIGNELLTPAVAAAQDKSMKPAAPGNPAAKAVTGSGSPGTTANGSGASQANSIPAPTTH